MIVGRCKCIPVTSDATQPKQAHEAVDCTVGTTAMGIHTTASTPVPVAVAKEDLPTLWCKEKAKTLLQKDILSNEFKKFKDPVFLWCSHPVHQLCNSVNFHVQPLFFVQSMSILQ